MLAVAAFLLSSVQDAPTRTPAIYRCPAVEAEDKFFEPLVEDDGFDTFCVEPKPAKSAQEILTRYKVKQVKAAQIDTPANLRWRNATIDFVNGKISPKAWLQKVKGLHETVHFLSSPKTPKLREATGQISYAAVFGEMMLMALPGKPCITADDTGATRYLPGPGREESWLLAMRDYLGPMLYYRADNPTIVYGKAEFVRADAKPGLLMIRQKGPKKTITLYLNNGPQPVLLPPLNLDKTLMRLGLDIDGSKPMLKSKGFMISES